jgi:hypothetical protein
MRLLTLLPTFLITATTALPQTSSSSGSLGHNPAPPALTFLYTSFVNITTPINVGVGPRGDRLVIPIVGGNFTGPKLAGIYPYKSQELMIPLSHTDSV